MMLVQKQSHFQLPTSPYNHHRRHPSAPVIVQPTRTPGLLSLSKPLLQQQLSQQNRQRSSPKVKQVHAQAHKPLLQLVPAAAAVSELKPSPEIAEKVTPPRGRPSLKPKDKPSRSASQSSIRGRRRSNGRQSSPPINPSQAEANPKSTSTSTRNAFDPFLDESPRSKLTGPPTLASRPSGKLARRRQRNVPPSHSPSKPVPVPSVRHTFNWNPVSRSDPAPSHMPRKSSEFPICDDMTEVGDDDDYLSPPSTPTKARPTPRSRVARFENGPLTAPLVTPALQFPFATMPSPPKKAGRKHKRAPSEGMFNMSSDEDSSSTGDLKALFELIERRPALSISGREQKLESQAAALAAAYFASSMFQNSPSPEDIPAPDF